MIKGILSVGLLIASAWLAPSCSRKAEASAAIHADLLARMPDDGDATGVRVDLAARRVRLAPGATVRYRAETRGPSSVRLVAASKGDGRIEASCTVVEAGTDHETAGASWALEVDANHPLEETLRLPAEGRLQELRLAWRADGGAAALELRGLDLRESSSCERPSILLIAIDTLSARHLSLYGYPLETDPELKRFAAESFLFERCLTNAPWTVPSFMSLMTGLYAGAHGRVPAGYELWEKWHLAANRWTLAESLRSGGYRTAGFVDILWLTEKFGFTQGFDVFDSSAGIDSFEPHDDPEGGIRKTTAQTRAFLEGLEPDAPFFVFLHAYDAHCPYSARPVNPARGTEPYDLDHTAPAGGSTWAYGIIPTYIARGEIPEGELPNPMHTAPIVRAYDQGIRFVDEELGKFFAYLRETGVLDRAWVILTADHGETMADSAHFFAHGLLVQDVMHVPLVVRPPGGLAPGKRIAETVQLADLYPTLIELAGLGQRSDLHGTSLVPLLRGEPRVPAVILAESGLTRQAMIVADGWKLVEVEPTQDAVQDTLLTHPLLTREWFDARVAAMRARWNGDGHVRDASTARSRREDPTRPLAWMDDEELVRDLFERLPVTGPTEELMARIKSSWGYRSLLAFVRGGLKGPFYELYDLDEDPQCERDLSAEHPEKLAEMKVLLEQAKARRTDAWERARPATEPVELTEEEIQGLEALGYGGGADED